jgi:hypothetical protein
MTYLKHLPKMQYTLGNRNIEVSDIFRRIAFTQGTRENPQNWKITVADSTQTVDNIAYQEYGDPYAYWQIMMMNNICSRSEAPNTYIEVAKTQEAYDKQMSFVLPDVSSDNKPKRGDYFVFFSGSGIVSYQIVDKYDSITRTVFCSRPNIFPWDETTSLLHVRKIGGGSYPVRTLTGIRRVGSYGKGIYEFYTNDGEISPYYIPSTDTFIDPNTENINNTNCLLDLILREQTLPTGYYYNTVSTKYNENITKRRTLKIPPAILVDDLSQQTEDLLKNGHAGESRSITGVVFIGSTNTEVI